ncbi:uncharacterized protein P174DRAFT_465287 [Aspergillus novofumigatus IBT 16806]|uniref:Uncharacterized protein n=1 Tax=Aspergillus novofumigatus (strain IBT 16806) TaxID=1392255 RepID=A0A2I1BSC6_ASPN1|nr:uncharacterized protein P174DRAFT_465287 [Aspergillus novofumigatus IBT 16806]PKX88256.1 hypothetical protein P174DRAFT_465287 [Aspergillus novofumigatus IBT 16806]
MHHPLEEICNSTRLLVLRIPRLLFLGLEHAWNADIERRDVTATSHAINVTFSMSLASMLRGSKREPRELEEQIGVDAQDREMIDRVLNRVCISLQSSHAITPG